MRILVLAGNLRLAGGLAVGANVVAALGKQADHEVLAVVPPNAGYQLPPDNPRCRLEEVDFVGGGGWYRFETLKLPAILRKFRPDVIWSLGNVAVRTPPCPQALLFMNPHFVYPVRNAGPIGWRARALRALRRLDFGSRLRHVQLLFAQTPTMLKMFQSKWKFSRRVALMPPAVSETIIASERDAETPPGDVLERIRDRAAFFCLTRYYPHKNLESIVACYERFASQLRDTACLITIDRSHGRGAARLLDRVERSRLGDSIVNVGPLRPEQLAAYYRRCDALLLPTLMESFSSAYVEAMHAGKPILTSDLGFAREICGDAAIYFNPLDPADMFRSLRLLADEPERGRELARLGGGRLQSMSARWSTIVRNAVGELERLAS